MKIPIWILFVWFEDDPFLLLTPTKKHLLVTFCDATSEIGVSFGTHKHTDGRMERRDG